MPETSPAGGYPVLYVLDAFMAFPTAATQVVLGSLDGRQPTVVVGIGYPRLNEPWRRLRHGAVTPA